LRVIIRKELTIGFRRCWRDHEEIAWIFERIADLLEINGELIFKVRACNNAADELRRSLKDLEQLRKENWLTGCNLPQAKGFPSPVMR